MNGSPLNLPVEITGERLVIPGGRVFLGPDALASAANMPNTPGYEDGISSLFLLPLKLKPALSPSGVSLSAHSKDGLLCLYS